jgi:hypothetical protein
MGQDLRKNFWDREQLHRRRPVSVGCDAGGVHWLYYAVGGRLVEVRFVA